jgi:DNA-binding CsgD family transcriptional regulator
MRWHVRSSKSNMKDSATRSIEEIDISVLLDHRTQSAIRRLLMAEPEPGAMLPVDAIEAAAELVGADLFVVGEADNTGCVVRLASYPDPGPQDPQVCDGPLPTGLVHDASQPQEDRASPMFGLRDIVWLGFATSSGTVVQLGYDRRRRFFTEQEIAVLTMMEPAIRRLVRGCAQPHSPDVLSRSERRVLALVSTGASNREVAEELVVTVHTVRKHLENAYRKLGVTNRTAAALAVRTPS